MNKAFTTFLAVLIILTLAQSFVIVRDTEKAILLKLGAFERTLEPGLNFKIPFVDNVIKFEGRLRSLDTPPDRVLSSESKPLNVDAFVKYRIIDAETYYTATNGGQTNVAEDTLQRRVKDKIRNEFGKRTLQEVVSGDRDGLMLALKDSLNEDAGELGVEIVDVRIKRADLPTQNLAATFQRMQAERERMAADERARGREAAQRVRALADRKAMEIVSEARRDAEIIRGEADAETTRLLAEAFGRDPEFYAFVRSLKAYEGSMTGKNTTIVLNPDSEFFDYIKESGSK